MQVRLDSPTFRSVFHWQYSGVVIPLLFGTGTAMALANKFLGAYAFFTLFAAWTVTYWLTSDPLEKRRRLLRSRNIRRNENLLKEKVLEYEFYKWSVSFVVLIIAFGCILWVRSLRAEVVRAQLKAERDDSFDKLLVTPIPLSAMDTSNNIGVSITNGAHPQIAEHTFSCMVRGLYNTRASGGANNSAFSPTSKLLGLLGGGRGETAYCHNFGMIISAPLACVDFDAWVDFTIVGQPQERMTKYYRFVGNLTPLGFTWAQQSPENKREFCGGAFGIK